MGKPHLTFDFLVFPDYIKRLRYCEYLGKYFCQCCHENAQMVIPSRVLRKWDFSKYYVSNFSKDLLIKIWNDPLFNVQDINSALYRKVKLLNQVRVRALNCNILDYPPQPSSPPSIHTSFARVTTPLSVILSELEPSPHSCFLCIRSQPLPFPTSTLKP